MPASEGIEQVYREDKDRLWRSLVGYSGDREVATDAMAEAFAQALRRGEALREPRRWVWRAAFRIAAGELQRASRERQLAADQAVSPSGSDLPPEVRELLDALSPKQRAVVVLRHYAGYSTREVAAISGCTPGTVRMHLTQARRKLRRLLEEEDG